MNRTIRLSSTTRSSRTFMRNYHTAKVVRITRNGPPEQVLKIESETLPDVKSNQVKVQMLAAPISYSDLSIIEGYTFPHISATVGGSEGVGKVIEVGRDVHDLKPNDLVISSAPGLGTWTTYGIFDREKLDPLPMEIEPTYASILGGAPVVAHCLLKNFVNLKRGDVLVQNGANSTVGMSVIQLAKLSGIKTINIIRKRPDFTEVVEILKGLGGEMAVSEEYAATPQFRRLISDLPSPKLALNGVGGSSATELARILGPQGTMVTYGASSRKPLTIPSSVFIHKDIQMKGFSLTTWIKQRSPEERKNLLYQISELVEAKQLKLWLERWPFSKFDRALKRAIEPYRDRKIILDFTQ